MTTKNYIPRPPLSFQGEQAKYLKDQLERIATSILLLNQATPATAVAFSRLPINQLVGTLIPVTDSTTNTWGATITGGGANKVLAYWNGTNWTVAAK
jgi:hypothetical protein